MAPRVRKNVWTLPAGDKTLEWYGKAVGVLKAKPISDPTSWWSLGAIHGFSDVWKGFKFVTATTKLPPKKVQDQLWNQCQHQSWYFLPWHRGYVAAFEAIIRNAIAPLGGPTDWALPYWNYSDKRQWLQLPTAFAKPTLNDGSANNLFVKQRYGIGGPAQPQNPILLDPRAVALKTTLAEPFYTGVDDNAPGFGGLTTVFNHSGGTFGVLETQPHGSVHVLTGGGFKAGKLSKNDLDLGLMTNPDTAALDPIFWLHHANIDRLWNVWLRQPVPPGAQPDQFKNPTVATWLNGPKDRLFAMPKPDGTIYNYTPKDMLNTKAPALNYVYDDEEAQPAAASLALRFEKLGASAADAKKWSETLTMTPPKPSELVGSNSGSLRLNSDVVESKVKLDNSVQKKVASTLEVNTIAAGATPNAPDRVYLNLENIKSPSDAAAFYVYVNLPPNADPAAHPELFAGTVSLFGARKASATDGPGGGSGLSASLNITDIVDKLHIDNNFTGELSVKLVAAVPGATSDDISIGRISIYRQGQ